MILFFNDHPDGVLKSEIRKTQKITSNAQSKAFTMLKENGLLKEIHYKKIGREYYTLSAHGLKIAEFLLKINHEFDLIAQDMKNSNWMEIEIRE